MWLGFSYLNGFERVGDALCAWVAVGGHVARWTPNLEFVHAPDKDGFAFNSEFLCFVFREREPAVAVEGTHGGAGTDEAFDRGGLFVREVRRVADGAADRAFVKSLMQRPIVEPGVMASWLGAPRQGIKGRPVDFQYVRRAEA